MDIIKISASQQKYWQNKLKEYKESYQSIGSESQEHKNLRYQRISEILKGQSHLSVLDVGAGFGDYYGFLGENFSGIKLDYVGLEISRDFCQIAREKYPEITIMDKNILDGIEQRFDFIQMSGLFHQHGEVDEHEWYNLMIKIIETSFENCNKVVSFNILLDQVDFRRVGNFYVNITKLYSELCSKFSRHIIIDQSYPLFEATIHILKKQFIKAKYSNSIFEKYLT